MKDDYIKNLIRPKKDIKSRAVNCLYRTFVKIGNGKSTDSEDRYILIGRRA